MTKAERERLIAAVRQLTAFQPDADYDCGECCPTMVQTPDFEEGYVDTLHLLRLLATFGDDES